MTTGAGVLTLCGGVTSLGSATTATVSGTLDLNGGAAPFDMDEGAEAKPNRVKKFDSGAIMMYAPSRN